VFETFPSNKQLFEKEAKQQSNFKSKLSNSSIGNVALLDWQEHCLECAVPECYSSCSIYKPREDKKCARFKYGIYPNYNFEGTLGYGADIRFQKWGKLEASMLLIPIKTRTESILENTQNAIYRMALLIQKLFNFSNIKRTPTWILSALRSKIIFQLGKYGKLSTYQDFVMECYCVDSEPFHLIFEIEDNEKLLFRHSFFLNSGHNFNLIPVKDIVHKISSITSKFCEPKIRIYPENDLDRRVIFTWLNFVSYKTDYKPLIDENNSFTKYDHNKDEPADKVKCVAWDLDNTLWNGILENMENQPTLRQGVLSLIHELDKRGIIQTIVSKNTYSNAWPILKKLNISDYFLHPAINWGQKSMNLLQIAEKLNININSFAIIDDSDFERAEVKSQLPQVRCYDENHMDKIISKSEFDVPITSASRRRLSTYKENIQREKAQATFSDNYKSFLISCKMKMRIFIPKSSSEKSRCIELIQRSNQLNLSTQRYSKIEFYNLLSSSDTINIAFDCADKFGDYGIVGYATIKTKEKVATLVDFVLSCRVAQKRVESTFFQWLRSYLFENGYKNFYAKFKPTTKNSALYESISKMPLELIDNQSGWKLFIVDKALPIEELDIITIQDEVRG